MQFLSDLSMVQRAGGAAVLVLLLVLLLVKQRQAKGAPAGKASAPKAESSSRMKRAPREKSGKAKPFTRGKKGKETAETPMPTAESKATSGRMVPRLPAAELGGEPADLGGSAQLDALAEQIEEAPATEATDGMISEPGWPTPGEVWASPDSVNGYGAGEQSWESGTNGAGEHDDPLAALTETPAVDSAGWATDNLEESFDPASGWSETDEETEESSDDDVPAWEKEQAEFDWTATDAESEWGTPDADEATDEISSAQAAWEAPEDDTATWSAEDLWEMPKEEPAEEVAPVATVVAEESFAVGEWMPEATAEPVTMDDPVAPEEPVVPEESAELEHTPTIVWDPVDEVEEIEPDADVAVEPQESPVAVAIAEPIKSPELPEVAAEPEAPVFELPVVDTIPSEEPVAEELPEVVVEEIAEPVAVELPEVVVEEIAEPVAEEIADPVAEIVSDAEPALSEEPEAEELPALAEVESVVDAPVAEMPETVEEPVVEEPPAKVAAEIVSEPVVEPFRPAVVVEHFHPFDVPSLDDEDDDAEAHMFEVDDEPVPVGALPSGPAARWASMMPGGSQQPTVDPVSSWSRLQPGATATSVASAVSAPGAPAPAPAQQAMPAATPGVAWWDVPAGAESDPRRGRFALGGYALQAGHQVVSGVTFRDGVVPPPTHWVIGPVMGAVAPGTLVLEVDGCLSCSPGDVEVLMDHGFAPTPEGFSLRLTAGATGPFAASGTFVIS
jgi:hypothetical protein